MLQTLFTRHAHGNQPVQVLSDVEGEELFEFQSERLGARELLTRLYGKPVHHSWRLYFRLGSPAPDNADTIISYILTLPKDRIRRSARVQIGVDLHGRFQEVRKIITKGFRGRILAAGYDLDDVIQDIFLGLLVRNNGKCPWDSRRGSMGHYVHMVTNCLLANHYRKESRRPERDADPLPVEQGSYKLDETEVAETLELSGIQRFLDDDTQAVLVQLLLGKTRREIAADLGFSDAEIARKIQQLRSSAQPWKNSQEIH